MDGGVLKMSIISEASNEDKDLDNMKEELDF